MSDPCSEEALSCTYGLGFGCSTTATCKNARWALAYGSNGFCNPPPACPDDEPTDVENGSCFYGLGAIQGGARCRYQHGSCFVYLECGPTPDSSYRWRPTTVGENTCDSCCPLPRPSVGEACATPGILCPGVDEEVICRAGFWAARAHLSGTGGAGGAAGSANPGGASGSGGSSCPEDVPRMNEPCVEGPACAYTLGCANITSTCVAGRAQVHYASTGTPGCVEKPDCPLEEPVDAASAACVPETGSVGEGACRYPHGSCYRYLQCGEPGDPRWHAPGYAAADSCCPKIQPTTGSPCTDDGALCAWPSLCDPLAPLTELACTGGTWQAPHQ